MDVTAFNISKHLSDLVGRHVAVKVDEKAQFSPETRTACYTVAPMGGNALVRIDFHLMASLSGTMIGVPPAEVETQVRDVKLDDNLTDASGELMNVLSAVIVSDGRAIFKGLFKQAGDYSSEAEKLLHNSLLMRLLVTPTGGKPGCMIISSDVC